MKQLSFFVAVTLVLVFVTSCGTDSGRSPRDGERAPAGNQDDKANGSGLWDMLARSERDKEQRHAWEKARESRLQAQLAKGMEQIPEERRQNMVRWWREFITMNPAWLENRHNWRAYGKDAREILTENLIIAMVRAFENNNGPIYKRARSELFDLSEEATPYLVSGLANGRGDAVTRKHCVEMLGWYGAKAVPEISAAYADADRGSRLDLLRAVKAMGPLGAPQSIPFLKRALRREDDYRLRLTAIQALGLSEDKSSIPVLIESLHDDDLSIRKFGAGTLGHFKSDESILAIIELLERTEPRILPENREIEVAQNCVHSLRAMTGENYRRGAQWRRWWNRR